MQQKECHVHTSDRDTQLYSANIVSFTNYLRDKVGWLLGLAEN